MFLKMKMKGHLKENLYFKNGIQYKVCTSSHFYGQIVIFCFKIIANAYAAYVKLTVSAMRLIKRIKPAPIGKGICINPMTKKGKNSGTLLDKTYTIAFCKLS